MSFTKDELQALHSIMEQRLSSHRRELERSLDQRMNGLRRDFEQRMLATQQELARLFSQHLSDQQTKMANTLNYRLDTQQTRFINEITQHVTLNQQRQQQHFESFVENVLAAQLLAMEQLLQQHLPSDINISYSHEQKQYSRDIEDVSNAGDVGDASNAGDIEVQTDITWEELSEVIGKALDDRLSSLNESLQGTIRTIEQHLSVRLHELREEVSRRQVQAYNGTLHTTRDVFLSIEELERVIESMQVAMTSNHALLSRRISNHQQLPPEKAHPPHNAESPSSASGTQLSTEEGRKKE